MLVWRCCVGNFFLINIYHQSEINNCTSKFGFHPMTLEFHFRLLQSCNKRTRCRRLPDCKMPCSKIHESNRHFFAKSCCFSRKGTTHFFALLHSNWVWIWRSFYMITVFVWVCLPWHFTASMSNHKNKILSYDDFTSYVLAPTFKFLQCAACKIAHTRQVKSLAMKCELFLTALSAPLQTIIQNRDDFENKLRWKHFANTATATTTVVKASPPRRNVYGQI